VHFIELGSLNPCRRHTDDVTCSFLLESRGPMLLLFTRLVNILTQCTMWSTAFRIICC